MSGNRCAVVVLPGDKGDPDRLIRSVRAAIDAGRGDFSEILVLPHSGGNIISVLRAGARQAEEQGCDWLLAVTAGETVVPDIFRKAAPALRLHDAVWGGAGVLRPGAPPVPLERITRLAAQDYATFFHLALRWWIGPSHFVRPYVALDCLLESQSRTPPGEYVRQVWRKHRAFKASHALTMFHGQLPQLGAADRAALLESLELEPVFFTVRFGDVTAQLPYTGRNPVIERDHTRGQFFEQSELTWLHGALPRGMRIVDAGANTGNHAVFFAAAMQAETVVPIEPDPRACHAIRLAAEANGLGNLDFRFLECAVGEAEGRMRPVYSEGGGLGATRLVDDPTGPIPVRPLDAMEIGPVDFLKIDVEGMEMAVLRGASTTIARYRPALFIEVLDETISDFLAWTDSVGYRVERVFPDKTHSNYCVLPAEKPA